MVRRSARLRDKTADNIKTEVGNSDERNSRETLEDLAKRTYNMIKEKLENCREPSRFDHGSDAVKKRQYATEKEEFISISSRLETNMLECHTLASELDPGMDPSNDLYFKMDQTNKRVIPSDHQKLLRFNEKEIMKKSVIRSDFEQKETAPVYNISHYAKMKQRKNDKEKSAGRGWFDMPAPEMTQELQRDLTILRMRNVLDPKRHYKKNNYKKLPKYFQLGTVVSGQAEFYSARIPKRERKGTIVESLLADAEFRRYNKRKYMEIQASKERGKKGFFRRTKRKRR